MRQRYSGWRARISRVSIHASVKDATFPKQLDHHSFCCFNPRICKRCDTKNIKADTSKKVSIHASVKDATAALRKNSCAMAVSIHASVKDATKRRLILFGIISSFNPRICKRCDLKVDADRNTLWVSIHASVKDATIATNVSIDTTRFQSTHL